MSTNEYIKRLGDERRSIWEQAKNILDTAERENRPLTADESARFDQASNDLNSKAERIRGLVAQEEQNKQTEELLTRALGAGNTGNAGQQKSEAAGPDEGEALRKFLQGMGNGGPVQSFTPATRNAAKRALVANRTGRPMEAEQRVFTKTTGTSGYVASPTTGGVLIPTTLYDQLVQHLVASSAILSAGATVLETAGANTIDIPITTTHGAAALTYEGATIAASDAAFTKRSLSGYKYGQLIQVSRELLDDEMFDIISYIATSAGRNVGLALGADLVAGNGTNKPSGILQTATNFGTGPTIAAQNSFAAGSGVLGSFTADTLISLMYSVIAPYRASSSAAWLVQDSSLGAIRKLRDGSGRYLFDASSNIGGVDSLLGKPIYTDPFVPAVGSGNKSVIFGDISRYFCRIAGGGVRFERSDDFAFGSDLVTFKAVIRADGVLVDQTGAVAYLTGAAS